MNKRNICLTEYDVVRLEELLEAMKTGAYRDRQDLDTLEEELSRAAVVESPQIPPSVVTMNSRVRLHDLDTGDEREVTLVFPRNADVDQGRISILSPIGTAILGYATGDTIDWPVRGGRTKRIEIREVLYQPEAAGDYHL